MGFLISGVRQEQDIYVRLIDSVTKQVRAVLLNNHNCFIKGGEIPEDTYLKFCLICLRTNSNFVHVDENGSLLKTHSEILMCVRFGNFNSLINF